MAYLNTGWLRRLNGQAPSKHLVCGAWFLYNNAFTLLDRYGNLCKRKQIHLRSLWIRIATFEKEALRTKEILKSYKLKNKTAKMFI